MAFDRRSRRSRNTSFSLVAFGRAMNAIANQVEENAAVAVRRAALRADQVVVQTTPVDTGRARGNYFVSFGAPSTEVDNESFGAANSLQRAEAELPGWNIGDGSIFITNSLPYIVPLDEGSSAQAPNGMSDLAIQAAQAELARGGLID